MSETADTPAHGSSHTRLVWDLPLRIFHWLLVLSLLASWLTGLGGYDYRPLHMWLGYWMLGLLGFRLIWGLVGTRHARFASFVPRPRALLAYVRGLVAGTAPESVGHNPLGSLMVFLMLALVLTQAVTGLFVFDDIMYGGPYRDAVSEEAAEFLSALHHSVIDFIVAVAVAHVAAVLYYTLRKKQPLVRAMLDGRKDASVVPASEAIAGSRVVLAIFVATVVAAFVYWLVVVMPA